MNHFFKWEQYFKFLSHSFGLYYIRTERRERREQKSAGLTTVLGGRGFQSSLGKNKIKPIKKPSHWRLSPSTLYLAFTFTPLEWASQWLSLLPCVSHHHLSLSWIPGVSPARTAESCALSSCTHCRSCALFLPLILESFKILPYFLFIGSELLMSLRNIKSVYQ